VLAGKHVTAVQCLPEQRPVATSLTQ
jgi:hypothetical protein